MGSASLPSSVNNNPITTTSCMIISSYFPVLLIHLGCFFLFSPSSSLSSTSTSVINPPTHSHQQPKIRRNRNSKVVSASPLATTPNPPTTKQPSFTHSIRFFLSNIFSSSQKPPPADHNPTPIPSVISTPQIFPCTTCGEVFRRTLNLNHHNATTHALSELSGADSGGNIVRIIFRTGWKQKDHNKNSPPTIHRIFKIHHSPTSLGRFEEYRNVIKSRAAGDDRCSVDGNERLRFYCATYMCGMLNGTCGRQFCSTCRIVRHGFSGKVAIATYGSVSAAHEAMPAVAEELVGRAMLICRVVAGRVATIGVGTGRDGLVFDSVAVTQKGSDGDDELVVFDPTAILPCFVVVYSV